MKKEVNHDALSVLSAFVSRRVFEKKGWRKGHTEELVVSSLNSLVDCIDQSREIDGDDNDQCHDCSPVDSAFVPVDTFVLVQHGNV
jgi:hypothetical protein